MHFVFKQEILKAAVSIRMSLVFCALIGLRPHQLQPYLSLKTR